jgi:hypothetical protein
MIGADLLDDWTKLPLARAGEGPKTFVNPLQRGSTILVTRVGEAEGSMGAAAALACAAADVDRASILVTVGGRPPRAALLASPSAQRLEQRLRSHLPDLKAAARGQVCHLAVAAEPEGLDAAAAAVTVGDDAVAVVHLPPEMLQEALGDSARLSPAAVLLRADLARDRSLVALATHDLIARGVSVAVLKRRLSWVVERRALFGALPAGAPGGLPKRLVRRLLPAAR